MSSDKPEGIQGSNKQVQQLGCRLFRIRLFISTWCIFVKYTHISLMHAHVLTLVALAVEQFWFSSWWLRKNCFLAVDGNQSLLVVSFSQTVKRLSTRLTTVCLVYPNKYQFIVTTHYFSCSPVTAIPFKNAEEWRVLVHQVDLSSASHMPSV